MHRYRTHTCGALREEHIGETVRIAGWVHRIRDHGGVLFVDLRDHYGITQCVADPDSAAFADVERVRSEWVVRIEGEVRRRPEGTENADLPTGQIELFTKQVEVLSQAAELPLPVFGEPDYPEDIRLRYRFIDLRRETLHRNIMKRTQIIAAMRRRMAESGFTEFATPILTASSPEGARDFLVPSRIHPGNFYALPQAPQQYKQLLMVAGFDRYFQIAPCFRDEDPRADRLPGEFYQLDLEMSFVEQEDVFSTMEPVLRGVFEEFAEGRPVTPTFQRIKHSDAMLRYGSDKPDLRNPLVITDVTAEFARDDVTFNAFKSVIAKGGVVRAIPAPGAGSQPRSFFDKLNDWARGEGAAGLGYIVFDKAGEMPQANGAAFAPPNGGPIEGKGPIAKFLPIDVQRRIAQSCGLGAGDAVFFSAGEPEKAAKLAGLARTRIGEELNLVDKDRYELCWIVDFPFYEWNEEEKKVDFAHNPFSMPQGGLEALETQDPLAIPAYQYDLVCNGFEIASGGIRNHRPDVMVKAFGIAGRGEEEVIERFGGMYRAFQYGAPPHGGMAAGVDRIVMLLCGAQSVREVALFPMNQRAEDILMGAPSAPTTKQLRELSLRVNVAEKG